MSTLQSASYRRNNMIMPVMYGEFNNDLIRQFVSPNQRITAAGLTKICEFLFAVAATLCNHINTFADMTREKTVKTVNTHFVQGAVRKVFPVVLMNYAVSRGLEAVAKYEKKRPAMRTSLHTSLHTQTETVMRRFIHLRISETAIVYFAAVLEYLATELTELAANVALDNKQKTITEKHIEQAVAQDEEFLQLIEEQSRRSTYKKTET